MAQRAALQVIGARELRRELRQAGRDVTQLRDRAHRPVAAFVAGAAQRDAPSVSGALSRSGRPGATQTAAVIRFGGKRVPYAGPIHFGWPSRGIKPQPFATAAAQKTEGSWMGIYEAAIEKILAEIKGMKR